MARTSLTQKTIVNINLMSARKKARKPRKKQSQIQLNRQSGLRMIPNMYPMYINPSVSQNPVASYAGTHQVDADVRVKPSRIEHPGLMTRQPVMPDPEMMSESMRVATQVQHQAMSPPSDRFMPSPLSGRPMERGGQTWNEIFRSGHFDTELRPLEGREREAREHLERIRSRRSARYDRSTHPWKP
jgi:hypothetical protein